MNKSHLVEAVASKTSLTTKDTERAITIFFHTIIEGLTQNDRVELRGFGSFKMKYYRSYLGRNPKDGGTVNVKAKRVPSFKPAKGLKLLVDQNA
jgi:integration host factor subunit beta